MRLRFLVDKERDTAMLVRALTEGDASPRTREEVLFGSPSLSGEPLSLASVRAYVDAQYRSYGDALEESARDYQKSWDAMNAEFFSLLAARTSAREAFDVTCVVSAFFAGRSSWGGTEIVRGWWENAYAMRKVTAHEVTIAWLWEPLSSMFPATDDRHRWALAELLAWVMLSDDPAFLRFWPWFIDRGGLKNYPNLVPHIPQARALYKETLDLFAVAKKLNALVTV